MNGKDILSLLMGVKRRPISGRMSVCFLLAASPVVLAAELSLPQAQLLALRSDLSIEQVLYEAEGLRAEAQAKGQLPDPVVVLGLQNLPTDTFAFDQEPMTQWRIGVRQMFPQGDTLALQQNKTGLMAHVQDDAADLRALMIGRKVRQRWLEIQYLQLSQTILEEDESLFQQLLHVTHSLYSVGKVKQQDVLRAELELSRLQEKQIKARRLEQTQRAQLQRWVGHAAEQSDWPELLPVITLPVELAAYPEVPEADEAAFSEAVLPSLLNHPMLRAVQTQITMAETDVALAEQQYKPSWGVELAYSYRQGDNPDGSPRSDFLSGAVTVSMPLFSRLRQDKGVQGANYRKASKRYALQDQTREMLAEVKTGVRRLRQIDEQLGLFDQEILAKARFQAEAALNAYQADAADFTEVMRAWLGEQKDRLDYLRLQVDRLQAISELRFYLPEAAPDLQDQRRLAAQAYMNESTLTTMDAGEVTP